MNSDSLVIADLTFNSLMSCLIDITCFSYIFYLLVFILRSLLIRFCFYTSVCYFVDLYIHCPPVVYPVI